MMWPFALEPPATERDLTAEWTGLRAEFAHWLPTPQQSAWPEEFFG